ncbi:MAG TPA: site-specific integrase, partial [Rhizobacter sp.]|nr:site-specific integrase [Rhizobacter sp.]
MAARASTADRRRAAREREPAAPADQALVAAFLERSWAEQGLSRSTLASYGRDLDGFARWLRPRALGLLQAKREHLFQYLAERGTQQY